MISLLSPLGRNNQSHMGLITSANLCTEVVQYSSKQETAVCTLSSVSLPRFVKDRDTFDFDAFRLSVVDARRTASRS